MIDRAVTVYLALKGKRSIPPFLEDEEKEGAGDTGLSSLSTDADQTEKEISKALLDLLLSDEGNEEGERSCQVREDQIEEIRRLLHV